MRTRDLDRRRFLTGGLAALGGATLLGASAHGRGRARASPLLGRPGDEIDDGGPPRTLVLLQLAGGNDGLNTIVPYGDDVYWRERPLIAVPREEVLPIDDYRGFHPALASLAAHHDEGRVAVIEGVGYPQPNRSHFKSFEIWHTARAAGRDSGDGWIGRLAAQLFAGAPHPNHVVHVGGQVPWSLHSAEHPPAGFAAPAGYRWADIEDDVERLAEAAPPADPRRRLDWLRAVRADALRSSDDIRAAVAAYRPRAEYPGNEPLAAALRTVAALVDGGIGTRVFSVELSGFDTHNNQEARQRNLLRDLGDALGAFLDDLAGTPAGDRTLVLAFSEFGRRVHENGSRGTDHGTAGPMFAAGTPVKGGLYGAHPSLEELIDTGDLAFTTDFRSVYATAIERWFGADSEPVLGGRFEPLPFLA